MPEFHKQIAAEYRRLPDVPPVLHEQGILSLQQLVLSESADDGRPPEFFEVVFVLLCLNDHLHLPAPVQAQPAARDLLGLIGYASQFNESSDGVLEFLCRLDGVFGLQSTAAAEDAWENIERHALGARVQDFIELFCFPLAIFYSGCGAARAPLIQLDQWTNGAEGALLLRWFQQGSRTLHERRGLLGFAENVEGVEIPPLREEFFRTPMVSDGKHVLLLSKWLLKNHFYQGLWGQLNASAKAIYPRRQGAELREAVGERFEAWAGALAEEARRDGCFKDTVLRATGADSEQQGLSDVVFAFGNLVVLVEVKAGIVPEQRLKAANGSEAFGEWFEQRLFEPRAAGKNRGNGKGGALVQLDGVIERLRQGAYENLGLRRGTIVVPALLLMDRMPGTYVVAEWLDQSCAEHGIVSARKDVRPVIILGPDDYDALLAYAGVNGGVARLLCKKVSAAHRTRNFDAFLADRSAVKQPRKKRLARTLRQFDRLRDTAMSRLKRTLEDHEDQVAM